MLNCALERNLENLHDRRTDESNCLTPPLHTWRRVKIRRFSKMYMYVPPPYIYIHTTGARILVTSVGLAQVCPN